MHIIIIPTKTSIQRKLYFSWNIYLYFLHISLITIQTDHKLACCSHIGKWKTKCFNKQTHLEFKLDCAKPCQGGCCQIAKSAAKREKSVTVAITVCSLAW